MATTQVETRRGLPVVRPKGKPFSYTVEHRSGGTFTMLVTPDGFGVGAPIEVRVYSRVPMAGVDPAEVWHDARTYYGADCGCCSTLDAAENFAAALRWAVAYARRWNRKHGFGEKGGGDGM